MSRLDTANKIVAHVANLKMIADEIIPELLSTYIIETNSNAGEARKIARTIAPVAPYMDTVKEWNIGMLTNPGDVVCAFNGPDDYCYIFTGDTPMVHTNPNFYPGASGVYYWAIIPHIFNSYRVYPDVEGIIVSVRQGDIWWDPDCTTLYEFIGEDNDNCNWIPGTTGCLWTPYLKGE